MGARPNKLNIQRAATDRDGENRPGRNGKPQVTDGPFAETKEQLGGYYLVAAKDAEEAAAIAAKVPWAGHGSVEVRPIMTFP